MNRYLEDKSNISDKCNSNSIFLKLKRILHETLELKTNLEKFNLESKLTEFGLNSISFIRIIVAIETEFEFEFDDEDLDFSKFEIIGNLIDYIESKIC